MGDIHRSIAAMKGMQRAVGESQHSFVNRYRQAAA
jgi:hypothetical protein